MIKIFIKSIITLFVVVMLFSCENSITTIQEITRTDTLPLVSAYNIEYERTDSGYLRVLLHSPKMERYEGKEPYTVFPDGFEITFYDTTGVPVSFIRANYGISYEKKKIMQARNDVVVKNYDTKEQLNTENLVWDQRKKTIFSNTFVKITSPDQIVYGDSLRSNESFTDRSIYHIRGELEVVDDTVTAKK